MKKNNLHLFIFSLGLLIGSSVFAQATNTMTLNLEKIQKATVAGDQQTSLDLMAEAKRQNPALAALPTFDLVRVEVSLRTGTGGADAHLIVNNLHIDSQSTETDGVDAKIQLKNSERRVESAVLMVIGQVNIKSVNLFFGAISETALLGTYASRDAGRVGQATPDAAVMIRPPNEVKARAQGSPAFQPGGVTAPPQEQCTILGMPCPHIFGGDDNKPQPQPTTPPVVAPKPSPSPRVQPRQNSDDDEVDYEDPWRNRRPVTRPPAPIQPQQPVQTRPSTQPSPFVPAPPRQTYSNPNCVGGFCVGNRVKNNFGIEGRVVRALPEQGRLAVKFPYSDQTFLRTPDELRRP